MLGCGEEQFLVTLYSVQYTVKEERLAPVKFLTGLQLNLVRVKEAAHCLRFNQVNLRKIEMPSINSPFSELCVWEGKKTHTTNISPSPSPL